MIIKFYGSSEEITRTEDREEFFELSTSIDCSDAPVLADGEWPDRMDQTVEWCTYRPTERGIVAVVGVSEYD